MQPRVEWKLNGCTHMFGWSACNMTKTGGDDAYKVMTTIMMITLWLNVSATQRQQQQPPTVNISTNKQMEMYVCMYALICRYKLNIKHSNASMWIHRRE